MRKIILFIVFISAITTGRTQVNTDIDFQDIKSLLFEQEGWWNQGSIDGYMSAYWESDSLRFITRKGVTTGWQQTLEKYKKSYPDKQTMGHLSFDVVSVEVLCDGKVLMVGKWTLTREKDPVEGYFSLIWKKIDGKWKIIVDHTS